ncbi:MAG TPA: cobalt ECF transporter T component CbiQ [Acidobacteriota bacterium]|nr:cobalt ECF transporter T component CbiQ [Acidobacteriota bacterium]
MYSENGQSLIHKSSPWTKIAFLLLLVSIVVMVQNLLMLLVVYAFALVAYWVGGLPKKKLLKWYLLPVFFVLVIAAVFIFNEPGLILIRMNIYGLSLGLTDAGLLLLMKLLVKSLTMVTFSFTLVMTTKYAQLVYLAKKLLPSPINSMFLLSYRFSFVIFENISTMLKAVRSRGGALVKGFLEKSRLYGAIFATSLIHSIEKAERVGKAMEARGFSGELPVYQTPPLPSLAGVLFITLSVVLFLISYLGGFMF